jgi:hypothetical protein
MFICRSSLAAALNGQRFEIHGLCYEKRKTLLLFYFFQFGLRLRENRATKLLISMGSQRACARVRATTGRTEL